MNRSVTHSSGFSLIEVLVAVGLMAVGLALAFGTLYGTARATANAEIVSSYNERVRAVQNFFRRQLTNAQPIPLEPIEQSDGIVQLFKLDAKKLEFVGDMPGYLSRGGSYLQRFKLVPGRDGGMALDFEFELMTPEGALKAERKPERLFDGISKAEFSARSFGPDGRPENWQRSWERPGQLPSQVRLMIEMKNRRFSFPAMIIPLRYGLGVGSLGPPPTDPGNQLPPPDAGNGTSPGNGDGDSPDDGGFGDGEQ